MKKLKILLIDDLTALLDFAIRCMAEGHEVKMYLPLRKNGDKYEVGDGLVNKVSSWQPHMKWADLIIVSDNCKSIKKLEAYRRQGYPIFGPNVETSDWEIIRDKGIDVFKAAGIEVIPSIIFKKPNEAIEYIKKNMKRFVSKPCGDAAKNLSYVSKSPRDMIFMLEYWQKEGKIKAPFLLQEFIGGIEFAVGGWFGKGGFSKYFIENFEHKKFLNDDLGPNTGESATIMKYVTESKLADMVLKPLEGELYRQGYTGYIDVAVIIDKKGNVWPLEFTTRPGFPIFQIQQILHPEPCQWMVDMINGIDSFEPDMRVAAGLRVCLPDYPTNSWRPEDSTGFPVYNITEKNRYFIHPDDMKSGIAPEIIGNTIKDKPMLVSCGTTVMAVSGKGKTIKDACDAMYKNVAQLEIPNSPMYRTDIGEKAIKQIPELQALGYAEEWEA